PGRRASMLLLIFKRRLFRDNVRAMASSLQLRGMDRRAAFRDALGTVTEIDEQIKREGARECGGPGYAEGLLQTPQGKDRLKWLDAEGGTVQDFIDFWTTDELTRRCTARLNANDQKAFASALADEGLTAEEVLESLKGMFALWGEITEKHDTWRPEDRPLPPELGPRYYWAVKRNGFEWVHTGSQRYGTVNAFIRAAIRDGSL
ncbi:MAG: hypothetical protein KAX19_09560, partial [Candidatus Brocadiae bacterium]|nr:hypothetical protein [Candidatus Brocadiia bacterium]